MRDIGPRFGHTEVDDHCACYPRQSLYWCLHEGGSEYFRIFIAFHYYPLCCTKRVMLRRKEGKMSKQREEEDEIDSRLKGT